MPAYKHGDAFALQLADDRFLSGRILLDVRAQCVKPDLIEADSVLRSYDGALLVEVYDAVTQEPTYQRGEPLLAGVFVMNTGFRSGKVPIVDHEDVDPTSVAFPEGLAYHQGSRQFLRGEVHVPLPDQDAFSDLSIYPALFPVEQLPGLCGGLLQQRDGGDPPEALALSDLRFSPQRGAVYEAIGEDPDLPYAELAAKHGYDITRFY